MTTFKSLLNQFSILELIKLKSSFTKEQLKALIDKFDEHSERIEFEIESSSLTKNNVLSIVNQVKSLSPNEIKSMPIDNLISIVKRGLNK